MILGSLTHRLSVALLFPCFSNLLKCGQMHKTNHSVLKTFDCFKIIYFNDISNVCCTSQILNHFCRRKALKYSWCIFSNDVLMASFTMVRRFLCWWCWTWRTAGSNPGGRSSPHFLAPDIYSYISINRINRKRHLNLVPLFHSSQTSRAVLQLRLFL